MSTTSTLRQATKDDSAKLKEIIDISFPRFFRFFAIHSLNSKEGKVVVAETQGAISGFVNLTEFSIGGNKYGCVLWIAVHPAYRLRGIAFSLTNEGVDELKKDGTQAVFASTQRRNFASQCTLAKSGFRRISFLDLWRMFGWRLFGFYGGIWYAPNEVVFIHE